VAEPQSPALVEGAVALREITAHTVLPDGAWFRGICAGEHVRTLAGVRTFAPSYVPGDGSPRDFYTRFGFRETGEVDDGELVMTLPLD
jgi:hypothetical protein